jgi:hypothetical protein
MEAWQRKTQDKRRSRDAEYRADGIAYQNANEQ